MKMHGCETWAPATVAAVETGRRNLSLSELGNICGILAVNLATLIGEYSPDDEPHGILLWALVGDSDRTPPMFFKPEYVDEVIRQRQRVRLEDAVLEKVTGRTHMELLGEGWREQVLVAIESHYGHDLLTERDQRVAAGDGNKTWASRRLTAEVAEIPGVMELIEVFGKKGEDR
jgi:hypothetical protein